MFFSLGIFSLYSFPGPLPWGAWKPTFLALLLDPEGHSFPGSGAELQLLHIINVVAGRLKITRVTNLRNQRPGSVQQFRADSHNAL